MDVKYFRERRHGPEIELEDAVVHWVDAEFGSRGQRVWVGGSVPMGAGIPDIIIASYRPQLVEFAEVEKHGIQLLAYLRSVRGARLDTICRRMRRPVRQVAEDLEELMKIEAVISKAELFAVAPVWRIILPEIVSVEAKVSDWKRCVKQARRNLIFSHKSFVALPAKTARRVKSHTVFRDCGIGVLGVDEENAVSVIRQGRITQPSVWTYYYQIAAYVARNCEENANAF